MTFRKWLSGFTAGFVSLSGLGSNALAEDNPFVFSVEAVFSGAIVNAENPSYTQPFTGEIGLKLEKEHYFDNGVSVGFASEIRAQGDNSKRQTFAGELQFNALNSTINDNSASLLPLRRSPATGLVAAMGETDDGPYATFEQGFAYVKAGWGELSVGRDIGAATRLDARAPRVLKYSSPNSSRLNPIAFSSVRARNDVTGPSAKLTYMSPRLIGFRAGASFTPEANARGIDFDASRDVLGIANANLKNVVEAGLSFTHLFRENDLRVRIGVTGIHAETDSIMNGFSNYESLGLGLEVEKGFWRLGTQYLDSNNAIDSGLGDYTAWETGISREFSDWTVTAEYGHAIDELQAVKGENWGVGVSKPLNNNVNVGVGYISTKSKHFGTEIEGSGAIIELIVRYE
ncbi:porin [Hirschia litorea]|uniref:Porin n=1 Tax=Hirschia litorea TaxID=1199156 RepID=A0ABW2IMX9_9PROT